jgi:predicted lipase
MNELLFYAHLADKSYEDELCLEGFTTQFIDTQGCQAYILTNTKNQYVVFRGTDELRDWFVDLSFKPTCDGIQSGFNKYANVIVSKLIDEVDISKEVVFIGHSLGGAVALILSPLFNAKVVSFGSPRVGTEKFINVLSDAKIDHLRVVNRFDYAPYIPMYPYKHYGKKITLKGNQILFAHNMTSYIKNINK